MPPATALRPVTRTTRFGSASEGAFTFAVTGDSRPTVPGQGFPQVTHRLFQELRLLRPSFVLYTGDFMWGYGGSRQEWLNDIDRFRALAETTGVPLYTALGNHEMQTDEAAIALLQEHGHDLYGSFTVGPWHFVSLNTDEFWLEGRVSGDQLEWLRGDLAEHKDAAGIFVFMHRPMYSWFQGDFNPDDQALLRDLFAEHPVKAVFAAHDHFLNVEEHKGVQYMTVAGAGSPLYAQPTKGGFAHYVLVTVGPGGVDYNVVVPGRLDVDHVAGNDGLEPLTIARVGNGTDRDLRFGNVEVRVPRLATPEAYRISVDHTDWKRERQDTEAELRSVTDLGDGSALLSLAVDVPTGVAFRVVVEARL